MAHAITLSELAWIFKRELSIMILLCCFTFCFYFSQEKKNKNKDKKKKTPTTRTTKPQTGLSTKFSWGFCLDLLCPTHLSSTSISVPGRSTKGSHKDEKPPVQNHSHLISLSWLMSATSKEVNSVSQVQLQGGSACPSALWLCGLGQSSLPGDAVGWERGDGFSPRQEQSPEGHLPAADRADVQGGWKLWDFRRTPSPINTFTHCLISKVAKVSCS